MSEAGKGGVTVDGLGVDGLGVGGLVGAVLALGDGVGLAGEAEGVPWGAGRA